MHALSALIIRNIKLFFKDKGMFFASLITPVILLVLYATFLGGVYRDSFAAAMPEGFSVPEKLTGGMVGGQLFSSLLAVCCVTVAFCSNMLMVQDKVTGARSDLIISPVKGSVLAMSYYIATALTTLIVCLTAAFACFLYLIGTGWYLSVSDVLLILLDVFLLVMFGTALSSVINFFLSSQGQISAVGTVVSAGYGFICGAYMPISQFGAGLRRASLFCPAHTERRFYAIMRCAVFLPKWRRKIFRCRRSRKSKIRWTAISIFSAAKWNSIPCILFFSAR